MSPAKQPGDDSLDENRIVAEFAAWIAANPKMTLARAAERLGYSATTLSQVMNGVYPGRSNRVLAEMARVLARVQAEQATWQRPPFVKTRVAADIISLFEACAASHAIGLVMGRSGVGKTETAEAYAEKQGSQAILVTAAAGMSGRDIASALASRYGIPWEGTVATMTNLVAGHLARKGQPLIIIDEADFLGHGLHTARQIHDRSGCGLVFLGTESFLPLLKRHTRGTAGQVLGRIAYSLHLDAIIREDAERIAAPFGLSPAGSQIAWSHCCGNARRLVNGLLAAGRLAGGGAIEDHHVAAGFESLIPADY